jgi:hypothetical protein
MKSFNIKITGGGTKEDIISSLNDIINEIKFSSEDELDDREWEDPYLYTEITEDAELGE